MKKRNTRIQQFCILYIFQARLAFNIYDRNRDGYLTKSELKRTSKNMTSSQIEVSFCAGVPIMKLKQCFERSYGTIHELRHQKWGKAVVPMIQLK